MRRYPLYVTIDTNIFDATGYDLGDDGTLGHLYSYVQSGKIKIVLSNIVIREAQKHIKEKAYEIATLSKKLFTLFHRKGCRSSSFFNRSKSMELKGIRSRIREVYKEIREKLYQPNFQDLTVVDFFDLAQGCKTYDEFIEKMGHVPESRLQYFGLAICGAKKKVNKLTGSMPLLR